MYRPMDTPKSDDALKALTARPFTAATPPPPKVVVAPELMEPEQLTDLTDDSNLEMWALGGTKILGDMPPPPPAPEPLPPVRQAPSYPPVAISYAPPAMPMPKKSGSVMAWVVGLGLAAALGLVVVAAGVGFFVYRANQRDQAVAATDAPRKGLASGDANSKAVTPLTLAVTTATPTATPTVTGTATATPTTTSGGVSSLFGDDDDAKPAAPAGKADGVLQTYAAASGKPVYVDGTRVGAGGSKIKTACGKHLVGVGTGKSKIVNIPCNGTPVTVGSPDGT
jgi:hypothetical protein